MNVDRRQFREIEPLVDEMLDGLIVHEGMEHLEQILDGNAELQKLFLNYCQLHFSLCSEARSKTFVDDFARRQQEVPLDGAPHGAPLKVEPAAPKPVALDSVGNAFSSEHPTGPHSTNLLGSISWFTALQLLFVFGLVAVGALVGARVAPRQGPQAHRAITSPVAFLTANTGCAWGSNSLNLQAVGSSVQLGDEITLQEGIAEFRLSNGVYISVEGPAGLVLTSPDSMELQYGKLTTHIPWPISEYEIRAGECRFTASDAEFGICVTGGRVDAHVFSGEVMASNSLMPAERHRDLRALDMNPKGQRVEQFTNAVIDQGRAIIVAKQKGVLKVSRWGKATPSMFATKLSMAGPLPVSLEYTSAVCASQPLGYWRFESAVNEIVPNEIPTGPNLNIVGDLRLSGLSGNRVAEFRPGVDCYLISRETFESLAKTEYSAEVWIKPSHVHCGAILGLCAIDSTTLREKCAFLLELESSESQSVRSPYSLSYPRTLRFLHRDPPERSVRIGSSCFSKLPYSIRRWQHVVAVKRAGLMELYIDGQLSASISDETLLAAGLHMIVGRPESVGSDYQFIGQLDELAIYSRALSSEEIRAHYQAIDWTKLKRPHGSADDI